jgi:ribosome-binding protein aMBF1 (putative translation factor)
MGHYCRICGRLRANEKFSGKSHKNHVCRDCSRKSSKKSNKNNLNKNTFAPENVVVSIDVPIQSEDMYFDDYWLSEIDLVKRNVEDEEDEELPF